MTTPEPQSEPNREDEPVRTPASPRRKTTRNGRREFLLGAATGAIGGGVLGATAEQLTRPNRQFADRGDHIEHAPDPTSDFTHATYSQSGEDAIVAFIFSYLKHTQPITYLDVGAYLPISDSNTYRFYQQAGHGVLIEPNIKLVPTLRETRPKDTVLNVGIGVTDQQAADYYLMTAPALNTFDKAQAEMVERESKGTHRIVEVVKMPLVPINNVIVEHFKGVAPDFLSIDVEGMDLAILKTLDWEKYRPKVLCVETLITLKTHMDPATTNFLTTKGYVPRAMTLPNTIYVDARWLG